MRHDLFASVPSARGVHPLTLWNLFDIRTMVEGPDHTLSALDSLKHHLVEGDVPTALVKLELLQGELKNKDHLHGSSIFRMPLDLARNELACVALSTTCDLHLLLDDDVQVEPEWIPRMMAAIDAGADIISAPCRLRDHAHGGAQDWSPFNVIPCGEVLTKGGLRLLECSQTGLGAVMVHRRVLEALTELGTRYASRLMPNLKAADIFTSRVAMASELQEGAPPDLGVYILDDVVFSVKARAAGFRIYAAIDVPTVHDGMRGCFSEELEKLDRARAAKLRVVDRGHAP